MQLSQLKHNNNTAIMLHKHFLQHCLNAQLHSEHNKYDLHRIRFEPSKRLH